MSHAGQFTIKSDLVVPLLDHGEVLSNMLANLKLDKNNNLPDSLRDSIERVLADWETARGPVTEELRKQHGDRDQARRSLIQH